MTFTIGNVAYRHLAEPGLLMRPFGLAVSWWHTNREDLLFQLRLVKKWPGRRLITVSVCSAAHPGDALEELCELCEHVVLCEKDGGHQDGTTMQCNGAVQPLWGEIGMRAIVHTDADTPLLGPAYFFGWCSLVLESGAALLTSGPSYVYDPTKLKRQPHPELGPKSHAARQFGSMFVLNRLRLLEGKVAYFPFSPEGNFETDRYTQFARAGLTESDAIVLPRLELPGGLDFSLGVCHSTNVKAGGRKRGMLRTLGLEEV